MLNRVSVKPGLLQRNPNSPINYKLMAFRTIELERTRTVLR